MKQLSRQFTVLFLIGLLIGLLACNLAPTPASEPLPTQTEVPFTFTPTVLPPATQTPLPTPSLVPTNTPDPFTKSQLEQIQKILPTLYWSNRKESGNTAELEDALNEMVMTTHVYIPTNISPWGGTDQLQIDSDYPMVYFWHVPENLSVNDRFTIEEFAASMTATGVGKGVFIQNISGQLWIKTDKLAPTDLLVGVGIILQP